MPLAQRFLFLEESSEVEEVYATVARQGISKVPESAEEEVDYHYICLVRSHINGRLYELDGDRKGPRDTGIVLDNDDVLGPEGLGVIRGYIDPEKSENFGLLALCYETHI